MMIFSCSKLRQVRICSRQYSALSSDCIISLVKSDGLLIRLRTQGHFAGILGGGHFLRRLANGGIFYGGDSCSVVR